MTAFYPKLYRAVELEFNRPDARDLRKEKRLLKKAVHRFATMQLVPAHAGK